MQLGARWRVGTPPHRGVPPELHAMIAEQESAFPEAHSWTLTWLEGRPRCALDALVLVTTTPTGAVTATLLREDGLPGSPDPGSPSVSGGAAALAGGDDADDDDDWLS